MSSNDLAISARGISKSYTIAHEQHSHSTLTEAMLHRLRHPFKKQTTESFQALNDVSFDIRAGEVVGVIGRNGAGKSTLLKVLSRITEPTAGEITLHGRVGSLLEVGTGFHPELTGRENIYLNGQILGMRRKEIDRQFEAIVAFSGVERFLDTPVKRYSSGMHVRLAFAVAAHLESEILIVDEVLAVGDADFQKRCLGKMKDVATSGRTVLFVSHHMQAVSTLCTRGMLMEQGRMAYFGDVQAAVDQYLATKQAAGGVRPMRTGKRKGSYAFEACTLDKQCYHSTDDIEIEVDVTATNEGEGRYFISLEIFNTMGVQVAHLDSRLLNRDFEGGDRRRLRFTMRESRLVQGDYRIDAYICSTGGIIDNWPSAAEFAIAPLLPYPSTNNLMCRSIIYPDFAIEDVSETAALPAGV